MPSIQIVVVSLKSAQERRDRLERHMGDSPFPWRFFDASDGGSPTALPYRPDVAVRLNGRQLKRSEIGCFDSHYRVIAEFVEDPRTDYLMVCEDDLWMDFGFPFEAVARAMRKAGVGYFRFYARRAPGARHIAYWCDRWLVRYLWEPFGAQCYLVSAEGARRLLAPLTCIARPIDDEFDRFWENGLPPYSFVPAPVLELSSPSSIVRSPDESRTTLSHLAYRGRRLVDRLVSVSSGIRTTPLDRRFAAALATVATASTKAP